MRTPPEKGIAPPHRVSTVEPFRGMQTHAPKRIYSPQSLEYWFVKLETDWSDFFTPAQLEEGRRIYRSGEVRELELTNKDAIVHRRIEKRDEYTVIEWEDSVLGVRSSTTDVEAARALAVAGLHEIEELICDEITPICADPEPAARAVTSRAIDARGITVTGSRANGHAAPAATPAATAAPTAPAVPPRPLILTFAVQPDGLAFEAYWQNGPKPSDSRTAAFNTANATNGASATNGTNGHTAPATPPLPSVTVAERTKLIGLAAYARKAHFTYNPKNGIYHLGAIAEIPSFLKTILPAWRRLFEIELDATAERILLTPHSIEIGAVATRRPRKNGHSGNTAAGSPADSEIVNGKSKAGISGGNSNFSGNDEALDLRWIFKAGERLLTDDEVNLVIQRGTAATLIPGVGIVSLSADRLETLKAWQRNLAETQSADGTLPHYLIFSLFNDTRLKITLSPEIEAWRQNVLTPPAETAQSSLTLPEILRPYQRRGVEWLHHLCKTGCHGLLADEMGLGKTLQVISLLTARKSSQLSEPQTENGKLKTENSSAYSALPTLIVCPASVVPVWQDEFAKFSPGTRIEVLKNGNDFTAQRAPGLIWIASYAQLRKHRALLETTEFAYAVLDEGQFIKNPDAKTTQTCFAVRAAHRIVLSGTPLENRQLDLWSIFRFLLPGLLGTRAAFEAALVTDRDATITRLRAQLAPFILRRTKDEVATELPPKIEMELVCPLTDVQRAEYARVCAEGLTRLGDDMDSALRERSFGFLALLTRLRQICCDPDMLPWLNAPHTDSGKLNLLVTKLAEIISSGHKVVIFSQFVMLLNRVHEVLAHNFPDLPRYEITGMTKERFKPVQAFQNAKGAAAMLVSLKAGGTGITLHAADYIFLLDPWWNPAVEAQAVDRVHRIGQANTVFVYRMVTAGTIEERIQALKDSKRGLFDSIVGGMGGDFDLNQHFKSLHELVQLTTAEVVESESATDFTFI